MRKFVISTILLSTIISCSTTENYIKNDINKGIDNHLVKILLCNTGKKFYIHSESTISIYDKKSGVNLSNYYNVNLFIDPKKFSKDIIIKSSNNYLYLNKKPYRGYLLISKVNNVINIINILKIKEYLFSVIPSEIPSSWDYEALKAQAIAARTYAYYHLINNKKIGMYDLDATRNFQMYKGKSVENNFTTNAVLDTENEVLIYNNMPIISYFHSTCGGQTADAITVWSRSNFDYLKNVRCSYCKNSPNYYWESVLTLSEIKNCINKKFKKIGNIKNITFKKKNGRAANVIIVHKKGVLNITGNNFRLLFPIKKIKSMYFDSKKINKGLKLYGHGWGHGVGMCQYGAKGMAENGHNYKSILNLYYKNISINKIDKFNKAMYVSTRD